MTKTEGSSARYCFSFIKFAQNFKKIEPMRKILLLLLCVPMLVCAKSKRDDSKYLVGAVPEVNGQVLFQQTFAVEGKNKQQIYDVMKAYLNQLMKGEQQMKGTKMAMEDASTGTPQTVQNYSEDSLRHFCV